ncbi:MAG: S8 family peptidase [Planctomycetota bacterium]
MSPRHLTFGRRPASLVASLALVANPSLVLVAMMALAPHAAAQADGQRIAPELRAAMAAAAPGELLPAYLVMQSQLDLDTLETAVRLAGPQARRTTAARATVVAQSLRAHSDETQVAARQILQQAVSVGAASGVRTLWIGNALVFAATPEVIAELVALPGVARVVLRVTLEASAYQDAVAPLPAPAVLPAPAAAPLAAPAALPFAGGPAPEPNLVGHQAPALWDVGFDGSGVLLGSIDSGVWWTHPDLVNRIWANADEIAGNGLDDDGNGLIDDLRGWDFLSDSADVTAANFDTHGTKSVGIAVGDGSSGVRRTGMAPGASLLICEVLDEPSYWLAQQYCLDEGVAVITSSYSYKWLDSPKPDYAMHRQVCDALLAAGIVQANSIGNQGNLTAFYPVPFNIAAPGNCPSPFVHPQGASGGRSAILACGGIDLANDSLYIPSGRGPAAWEDVTLYQPSYPWPQNPAWWDYPYGGFGGGGPGLLKPDLAGYTVNIQTTTIGPGFSTFSGTSAATPHLGGALCLLRQVQPAAEPRHLAAALEFTAADLGAPGKDGDFGSGKIQVFDAARRLRVLGRFDDITPSLGQPILLELFGPPSATVYAYLGLAIADSPSHFNLVPPFLPLAAFGLDGTGEASIPLVIPSDPLYVGLNVWLQFGAANDDPANWGPGPMLSVPEGLTIGT